MIPYVEVIDKKTLKQFALVEPTDCWFKLAYQDVGVFEVYCTATSYNLKVLKKGHYVKIPNKRFIWVITAIRYTFNAEGTRMILASGKEAKWLLHKRIIRTPTELQGTLTESIDKLVDTNLGAAAEAARRIEGFTVNSTPLLIDISGTQATRGNLLEFVTNVLKSYNCGHQVIYEGGQLKYQILNGDVKTQSVRFSQALDNLLSSEYYTSDEELGTHALVVSKIEEVDYIQEHDEGPTGVDRSEVLVESNLSTKYTDAAGNETTTEPTSDLYKGWQREEGKNKLNEHKVIEEVKGEIDIAASQYEFDKDFYIGDMIRIQDEFFEFGFNTRITTYTIKQDAKGYGEEAEYGGE